MKKHIRRLVGLGLLASALLLQAAETPVAVPASAAVKASSKSTTDHSKLEALKGPFKTGPEVTKPA